MPKFIEIGNLFLSDESNESNDQITNFIFYMLGGICMQAEKYYAIDIFRFVETNKINFPKADYVMFLVNCQYLYVKPTTHLVKFT